MKKKKEKKSVIQNQRILSHVSCKSLEDLINFYQFAKLYDKYLNLLYPMQACTIGWSTKPVFSFSRIIF